MNGLPASATQDRESKEQKKSDNLEISKGGIVLILLHYFSGSCKKKKG